MKTKEAIWYFKNYEDYDKHIFRENIDCILKALKRGETFEKMWEEIRKNHLLNLDDYYLEEVEQKYFPKEVNND